MKKLFLSMAVGLVFILSSCDKANDETLVNEPVNETETLPDGYLEDEEFPLEIEITEDDIIDMDADAELPRKYCVWEVSETKCPDGKEPKFKKGDKICYRCDDRGCSADRVRIIIISDGGRNFGDGCRTYGKTVDTSCKVREDCAGKYYRR